jgi:ketosteroid isomerase-like protein
MTMKAHWKKLIVSAVGIALLAVGCSSQPDMAGIVKQVNAAINKGDVANAMTHYTDDAVLIAQPFCPPEVPCHDKPTVQHAYEQMTAGGTQATIVSQEVSGNTVKSRLEVRGSAATTAGVERFVYTATVTFTGDKISKEVDEYDVTDQQTATFVKWLQSQ